MNTDVFSERGKSLINQKGELVCKSPFPSMPKLFWNDKNNENIRVHISKNIKMFGIMEILLKENLTEVI